MSSLLIRCLIFLFAFSSLAEAQEGLSAFSVGVEKKLARLAGFITTSKSFAGKAGIEQTLIVDVAANGQVVKVVAQEPTVDKALADEGQRLILIGSPFSALPAPLSEEFPMVRLHVTFALTSQPGLSVKRVEPKGGYKYVPF